MLAHPGPVFGAIIFIACLTGAGIYIIVRTTQEHRRDKIRSRIRNSQKEAQRLLHPIESEQPQIDGTSGMLISEPQHSFHLQRRHPPTWAQYSMAPNLTNHQLVIELSDSNSFSTYHLTFAPLQPRDSNIPLHSRKHKFISLLASGYVGILYNESSDEPLGYITRPFSAHLPKIHITGRCFAANTVGLCSLEAHVRSITRHPRNGRLEFGFNSDTESGTGIERTYHWHVSKWVSDYGTENKRPRKRVREMQLWEDGAFFNRAEGLAATWTQLEHERGGALLINEVKARNAVSRLSDCVRERFIAMVICSAGVILDNVDQFGFCEDNVFLAKNIQKADYLDVPDQCEGCGSHKVLIA